METKKQKVFAGVLLIVGLLQMIGNTFDIPQIKALALAWGASPAPKVFSTVDGLETFSSQFYFVWTNHNGSEQHLQITPELAKNLQGPYNRRNVYGACLSYGPIFKKSNIMRDAYDSVMCYAMRKNGGFLHELGINSSTISGSISIQVVPKHIEATGHLNLITEVEVQ